VKDAKQKRQKNILVVENQLSKATLTTPEMTTFEPQNPRTDPLRGVGDKTTFITEKRMVAPGSKDAPKFRSTKPDELRRFIRSMEDLWRDAGVTDDQAKKEMIGKYADQISEEEWAAFKTFDASYSWDDFKDDLIENYPEAAAAERGTPARIRLLCFETEKVRLGDMPALYSFRRAFMAEAKKLQQPPAVMGNRELVELFIGRLSDPLASAVLQYLGNMKSNSDLGSGKSKAVDKTGKVRRPEDKYDLDDICKAAIEVSGNSQGMFNLMNKSEERGVLLFTQPVTENKILSEKLSELEGEQALEKDRLASLGKTIEARMGGLEDMLKTLMKQGKTPENQGDCKSGNCKAHDASSNPVQRWGGKSVESEKCFWCGFLGHFQADCEDLKNQLRSGNVKMNQEGKLRLRDGSHIPRFPTDASFKERVERHYAKKPSQYFYGEYEEDDPVPSAASGAFSQFMGSNNDADKRIIAQLKAELDLKKREEALALKQKMFEQREKMIEKTGVSSRAANVLELLGQLTDEELAGIQAAKSGFN
jgi:hypothetical protein